MELFKLRRRHILLWQLLFLIAGTSWLWAPHLNPGLSYRTSLISQYEIPFQPFSWLFRAGDVAAGTLLLAAAVYVLKSKTKKTYGWLLLGIGVGLVCDPLLSTSCRVVDGVCREYFSLGFLAHAIETVATGALFFAAAVYDSWKRKKLVSILFAFFQIGYGLLFISQLADQDRFNTASQYIYQTVLIVWLAWFCRDILVEKIFGASQFEERLVRSSTAIWAFINGVLAIVISLAHINLLGRIRGLYFSGDSAWLAQHGIVIGVIMIYLARHLARGEARARQIFLLITGLETIKYAVISPHAGLMLFYSLTFVGLFLFRDDFDRGSLPLTWSIRLRDMYFLVSGLLVSALAALAVLDRDNRASLATARAADNFSDYVFGGRHLPYRHLDSVLLAHSFSVFLAAGVFAILWVLFRPYGLRIRSPKDYRRVQAALEKYSASSEDFFKLWPADKNYYWGRPTGGFVAYKIVAGIAFVLADPIGARPQALIIEFTAWCRERRLKVCYLPVYSKNLKLYERAGLEVLHIGSSAVISTNEFLSGTIKDKWWRWRINKAGKSGYVYNVSQPPHSRELMDSLKKVSDSWLRAGGHAERSFAMGYFDKKYLQLCPIHYLSDSTGSIIAFSNQLPQFKNKTVFTVDLLRYEPATESMAFLLYNIIETSKEQGYSHFDLGFVPFARARGPLLAIAKTLSADKFSAKGLEQFKNKFNPDWQPNYLAYDGDMTDLAFMALTIEKAMAHGHKA